MDLADQQVSFLIARCPLKTHEVVRNDLFLVGSPWPMANVDAFLHQAINPPDF
ncbi:hypothetical protein [Motiliproteus sp.]|uniref:hypothetical protein n=1 Tax=Motiliproteus sp. TaxID=1898955 RepID=UPI003BA8BFC1